jgi:sigma-B regulation protein RsbU (phosphoserine phosphatase)
VVLEPLDGMVRHTTDRRMLVTLLASFLDPAAGRLKLSSAGHPPPLRYAARTGTVEEIACPALPLGTRLKSHYAEVESPLEPGDLVCFFTDGLTETSNGDGDAYGLERLTRILAEAAGRRRPAREVRNALLADLSNFKGDVRRGDDVTLVVVRVR